MKDIETRADIEVLVNSFYEKIKKDDTLMFFFEGIRKVDWETHLPVMYDFWENVLFFTGSYNGNPLALHKHIHRQVPLTRENFDKWLRVFDYTVDELFQGSNASLVKRRAANISTIMQIKILDRQDFTNQN